MYKSFAEIFMLRKKCGQIGGVCEWGVAVCRTCVWKRWRRLIGYICAIREIETSHIQQSYLALQLLMPTQGNANARNLSKMAMGPFLYSTVGLTREST